ncbi:hypothetical protein M0812_01422 [Anaeramoeba flamelloides]|uniref:PAS domain-containing protein n=1 Tax=Anaeramoeba flamelloides TaxID=1746091 RepID=A0AAV8A408_9EUKA|nr:hypothetical protein M0812_01422 [Anaeramoeba flamelloides]
MDDDLKKKLIPNLEKLNESVLIIDPDSKIIFANKFFLNEFGVGKDQALTLSFVDFIQEETKNNTNKIEKEETKVEGTESVTKEFFLEKILELFEGSFYEKFQCCLKNHLNEENSYIVTATTILTTQKYFIQLIITRYNENNKTKETNDLTSSSEDLNTGTSTFIKNFEYLKKMINEIEEEKLKEQMLIHLNNSKEIYDKSMGKKKVQIEDLMGKLETDRKNNQKRYENLEEHLQRNIFNSESKKDKKKILVRQNLSMKNQINKISELIEKNYSITKKIKSCLTEHSSSSDED